jgi:hypothetical protein
MSTDPVCPEMRFPSGSHLREARCSGMVVTKQGARRCISKQRENRREPSIDLPELKQGSRIKPKIRNERGIPVDP